MLDGEHAALVLVRPFPLDRRRQRLRAAWPGRAPGEAGAARRRAVAALAGWLAADGVDVVASDAEIPAADGAYRPERWRAAGFQPIPEIQPSRHRVSLALPPDTDDAAVRAGITKSTRQRIDAAERDGIVVQRHDTAGWAGGQPLFAAPTGRSTRRSATFATLLEGTGERRGFRFGPRDVFVDWWRAAHAAGLLVYLEARDATSRALARRAHPVSPRRAALDRPLGRRARGARHAIPGSCTCSAGGRSSWHPRGLRRDGPRWRRRRSRPPRARRRRRDGRAVRAQALVRGDLGRDARRPGAGHPAVALRARPA